MPGLFASRVQPLEASLSPGAAIAITAFRIACAHHPRGRHGRHFAWHAGLTAGAVDNALPWCNLAVVLASFGGLWGGTWLAIRGRAACAPFMACGGHAAAARLGSGQQTGVAVGNASLAVVLALFKLSAFAMDAISIHNVFGGFLLGACMPRGVFVQKLREEPQPFVVVFLLPMFFTCSGLNTRLDILFDPAMGVAALASWRPRSAAKVRRAGPPPGWPASRRAMH
ncbi:cation:proton antiporter [Pseudorhodoferax sp. Leaf265]|uniref:cation:proton antiporter domain-containing protein n=1 Tax=Pseudorhodoferax sp. Leaf265 TaxID=1736315 RepID=UPI002101B0B6|nr:cation:proton antiporter [Pseudorhodoferax sp. Leaf265]